MAKARGKTAAGPTAASSRALWRWRIPGIAEGEAESEDKAREAITREQNRVGYAAPGQITAPADPEVSPQ